MKGAGFFYERASFQVEDLGSVDLSGKSCVLLISVGQRYHEQDKLSSTIHLINASNFSSCSIMVADSLQRHTFSESLGGTESEKAARLEGEKWIERNLSILRNLTIPFHIKRWDECLNHPKFKSFKRIVASEYESNSEYADAIDGTIQIFIERAISRDPSLDTKKLYAGCLEYLLEECPIIMPLWAEEGHDYIIYPKKMTRAMSKTRELFVQNNLDEKAQWLPLKFKKKFCKEDTAQQLTESYTHNHQAKDLEQCLV